MKKKAVLVALITAGAITGAYSMTQGGGDVEVQDGGANVTATPTPEPSATPTESPTATPTATPEPDNETATPTPTPSPTPTEAPDGGGNMTHEEFLDWIGYEGGGGSDAPAGPNPGSEGELDGNSSVGA